ncbi:MAG TPA: LuxR C-terminal-related transcriptional regulator [Verrucomicrobiae bacterium]|nr:LuxR C-terminal-related transcriptional regulator [Verrucomicrobiae bacterium]
MPARSNAEIRAALRNQSRVRVAIATGVHGKGIKLLIGAPPRRVIGQSPVSTQSARRLTGREIQVLRFIAKGLHNRQIAHRIQRSIKTVEKHRQSLHTKLSTHEVAGLTRHALAMGLMGRSPRARRRLDDRAKLLTPRELEVLRLVAQGSGNKWIASELQRSIKTVDHHRENIMKKLGIHEVAGLTSYAVSLGLL